MINRRREQRRSCPEGTVYPLWALAPRSGCLVPVAPTLSLHGSECEVVAVDSRLAAITLRHGGVDLPIALSAL
jgi:hypothetical protein